MQPIAGHFTPVSMRRRSPILPSLVLAVTILAFCNLGIAVTEAANSEGTVQSGSMNMSDIAHSNKVDPHYEVVFPDDHVNVMTITISPANWKIMLDNMTELYGLFGGGSSGIPGAQPGDAGINQGGSPGMGGMFSETDPVYVPADITFEGIEWPNVGIRFKGFNSLMGAWNEGSYKISLKLNFDKYEDEYPEIKNQRFYGFDELNLQGNYNDDSLMRDMVVPSIFRESGVPAPYTAFYRLFVDYGEGPVYFGLYTMVEAVEDTVIETQFSDDSGNLYKPEGNGATFAEGSFNRDSFEKKTNEDEADYSDVEALYTILNSDTRLSDPEQWRQDLESVFDVDTFLRWLATNTVIQNWDTYGGNCRNFYLYTDPADGKITWIPWDNNYALNGGMGGGDWAPGDTNFGDFGGGNWTPGDMPPGNMIPGGQNNNPGGGMGSTLSLSLDEVGDTWPLIRFLADDPVYYAQYQEYLGMVASTSFEPSKMEDIYRYYHSLIEPYVTGPEGELSGYTHLGNPTDFDTALDELITHVNSRYVAVWEFLSTTPIITPTPTPTQTVTKDTTSPKVSITAPAQSCAVTPGEEIVIRWSATDETGVERVTILYSTNRGVTWVEIADNLPDEGSSTWTVPDISGSMLILKVRATDAAGNAGSAIRSCRLSSTDPSAASGSVTFIPAYTKPASISSGLKNISSLQAVSPVSGFTSGSPESAKIISPVSRPVSQQSVSALSIPSSNGRSSISGAVS